MQEHFAEANDMKAAVIKGDLLAAKRAAAWLANNEWTPRLRADWRPYMAIMQFAARGAEGIADTTSAAEVVSRIGRACGHCHQGVGGPVVVIPPPPQETIEQLPRVTRHAWAAERLWEGLTLSSNEAWTQGATVLADAPLESLRPGRPPASSDTKLRADKVQELARRALTVDVGERRPVYADLLSTCSDCHRALGVAVP